MNQDTLTIQVEVPEYLDIIGDSLRFRILQTLSTKSLTVEDLIDVLNAQSGREITQSAVSHALRVLKVYDLVSCEQSGRWHTYSIRKDVIAHILGIAKRLLSISDDSGEEGKQ